MSLQHTGTHHRYSTLRYNTQESSFLPCPPMRIAPGHPASCLPDSNPYGRDGLAHSRSLSTARRALRVA